MITERNLEEPLDCPYCKISSFDTDFIQIAIIDVGEYEIITYACLECEGEWDEIRKDGRFLVWIPISE